MTGALHTVARDWTPEPVRETRLVDPEHARGFARWLDQPDPLGPDGEVPPLWHWFSFTPRVSTAELGEDGHPAEGRFFPPLPHRRRMVAGGQLDVVAPFVAGREHTRETQVESTRVLEGGSGAMLLVRVLHRFLAGDRLIATEREDVVYRSQPPGAERPLAADPTGAEDPSVPDVALATDEVRLFRFSALTANAHRIHYDHPYTTTVERYPSLVVHGPLLALAALEPFRQGPMVRSMSFRLRRPMFAGDVADVRRTSTQDGSASVEVTSRDRGVVCASAVVTTD